MKKQSLEKIKETTCLVLEWVYLGKSKASFEDHSWRCDYYLNLPLDLNDIRREGEAGKDGRLKVPLGGTNVQCSSIRGKTQINEDGTINTPFRDGCHIQWDAERLRLPMYVISEGKAMKIDKAIAETPMA